MKRKSFIKLLVICLVVLLTSGIYLTARLDKQTGLYTPRDKEYYLSPEEASFIRPGLKMEI